MKALHVGALPHALRFFTRKDVCGLDYIQWMVDAGMSLECARETAQWYASQCDEDGLDAYVVALEALRLREVRAV